MSEEPLIQKADPLDNLPLDHHGAAYRSGNIRDFIELPLILLAVALLAEAVHTMRREAQLTSRPPDHIGLIIVVDLGPENSDSGIRARNVNELSEDVGVDNCVVVEQKDVVEPQVESPHDTEVIATVEAQVDL